MLHPAAQSWLTLHPAAQSWLTLHPTAQSWLMLHPAAQRVNTSIGRAQPCISWISAAVLIAADAAVFSVLIPVFTDTGTTSWDRMNFFTGLTRHAGCRCLVRPTTTLCKRNRSRKTQFPLQYLLVISILVQNVCNKNHSPCPKSKVNTVMSSKPRSFRGCCCLHLQSALDSQQHVLYLFVSYFTDDWYEQSITNCMVRGSGPDALEILYRHGGK
jgi:hypothetical protein